MTYVIKGMDNCPRGISLMPPSDFLQSDKSNTVMHRSEFPLSAVVCNKVHMILTFLKKLIVGDIIKYVMLIETGNWRS